MVRLTLARWPTAAVLIDPDGHIASANRAAARLFGCNAGKLRQLPVHELIPAWRPLNNDSDRSKRHRLGHGRRVMYIDDEEALVYLMIRVLQRSGYQVTGFSDAVQALQTLRERPWDFDVIVTDLSMPVMSGFHVASAIREIREDLPVVVTSGYVRAEDRETARKIGVRELVLKPDTVEELAGVLEKVFEHPKST